MDPHQKKLFEDLANMQTTIEKDLDLTFVCRDGSFQTSSHLVKARCEPIRAILSHDNKESKHSKFPLMITHQDILVDLRVGQAFLNYITQAKREYSDFSLEQQFQLACLLHQYDYAEFYKEVYNHIKSINGNVEGCLRCLKLLPIYPLYAENKSLLDYWKTYLIAQIRSNTTKSTCALAKDLPDDIKLDIFERLFQ